MLHSRSLPYSFWLNGALYMQDMNGPWLMMGLYYCKLKIQVKNYFTHLDDLVAFGFLRGHFDQTMLESRRSWEVMWETTTKWKASYSTSISTWCLQYRTEGPLGVAVSSRFSPDCYWVSVLKCHCLKHSAGLLKGVCGVPHTVLEHLNATAEIRIWLVHDTDMHRPSGQMTRWRNDSFRPGYEMSVKMSSIG